MSAQGGQIFPPPPQGLPGSGSPCVRAKGGAYMCSDWPDEAIIAGPVRNQGNHFFFAGPQPLASKPADRCDGSHGWALIEEDAGADPLWSAAPEIGCLVRRGADGAFVKTSGGGVRSLAGENDETPSSITLDPCAASGARAWRLAANP